MKDLFRVDNFGNIASHDESMDVGETYEDCFTYDNENHTPQSSR